MHEGQKVSVCFSFTNKQTIKHIEIISLLLSSSLLPLPSQGPLHEAANRPPEQGLQILG